MRPFLVLATAVCASHAFSIPQSQNHAIGNNLVARAPVFEPGSPKSDPIIKESDTIELGSSLGREAKSANERATANGAHVKTRPDAYVEKSEEDLLESDDEAERELGTLLKADRETEEKRLEENEEEAEAIEQGFSPETKSSEDLFDEREARAEDFNKHVFLILHILSQFERNSEETKLSAADLLDRIDFPLRTRARLERFHDASTEYYKSLAEGVEVVQTPEVERALNAPALAEKQMHSAWDHAKAEKTAWDAEQDGGGMNKAKYYRAQEALQRAQRVFRLFRWSDDHTTGHRFTHTYMTPLREKGPDKVRFLESDWGVLGGPNERAARRPRRESKIGM